MKSFTIPLSLLGVVLVLAGGLAYLLNPEAGYGPIANLGLGLALIVVAGVLNPDLFRQYGRWLNAFWGGIMVLGIIVMVNFLTDRYPRRLDLTEGKLHSLSDLTRQTLKGLTRDVEALAFMEGGTDEKLEALLKEYRVHSSHFHYEFIDPDRDPERADRYGVKRYNTLVIASGDRQQKVTELQEKEITNALLKVIRDRQEKVYLTVGHGEAGLGREPQALGLLQERLKEIDYAVEDSLFLAREGEVPLDCSALLIVGPRTPFLANEVEAIRRYLERGGSLFAFLDPLYDSGLKDLLARWGVQVGDDFVIDTSGIGSLFGLDFTTPVSSFYGDHPIAQKHRGLMTFFRLARSVSLAPEIGTGLEGVELVRTSSQGWAETDLAVLQQKGSRTVRLDQGVDRPGPISLGVAVSGRLSEGGSAARLVVFGDSDFATNQFFDYQGNGDLVLNALSWLVEDEGLISIRPRQAGYNPIALTERQGEWIFWISVVLMPAAVALVGLGIVSRKGRWSLADLAAAGLGIALSLGVVGLVNFIGERYHYRLDMTEDKLFTLSQDTRKLLDSLVKNGQYVQVKTFLSEMEGMRLRDLLKEYKYRSKNFDYEILDPQKNALQVKQYGIREEGTSIVEGSMGGRVRTERTTEQTEEGLSNAIRRALKAQDQKIYFTSGHGEADLDQVDGEGFSILKGRLKEMNFEVVGGLQVGSGIPDDAAIVAVLSPKVPFTPAENEALRRYLRQGRAALFLLDPGRPTGLEGLLSEWGIELGQDFVVDLSGLGQLLGADVSVPVVIQYGDHPVTEKIARGTMTFFPLARSVAPAGFRRDRVEVESLVLTHRSSWGEKDLSPILGGGGGKVDFDPAVDVRGPLSLAVAARADADTAAGGRGKTRVIVFGDSDFASNQYFGQQANGELLVSAFSWLSEGEEKLNIPNREPRFNPINLIGNQGAVILWVSVFILPFAVALSGLVMVLRRGYAAYVDNLISWLIYTFLANAVFFFATGIIGLSEGKWLVGQGKVALAVVSAGAGYGLYRRARWVWEPALALALLSAVVGFWVIPGKSIQMFYVQLLYAAVFAIDAAVLLWIRKTFDRQRGEG